MHGCLAKEGVICLRNDAGHVLACVCLRLALARLWPVPGPWWGLTGVG